MIEWRLHLRSAPPVVFRMLSTAEGRAQFWAESAEEQALESGGCIIRFRFPNGQQFTSVLKENIPASRFRLSYFGGSTVTFDLQPDGAGGTDLRLCETGASPEEEIEDRAGWVSVLLTLKAAVDFGVDLRNHDPARTWDERYVDA